MIRYSQKGEPAECVPLFGILGIRERDSCELEK